MDASSKTRSTAARQQKHAASDVSEDHGIFRKLRAEHAKVTALLERVATTDDPSIQSELYPTIRKELLVHAEGKEDEVYPVMRQHPELEPLVGRSLQQHDDVEHLLNRLDDLQFGTAAWANALGELKEAVQRHVHDEEHELFPAARQNIAKEQARAVEKRYLAVGERMEAGS